jgi:hypothetical protein
LAGRLASKHPPGCRWFARGCFATAAKYANANPELKAWFDALKSDKGPCCSDADGTAVSDADR